MADRVQEAIFWREQAGRHARVEGEGQKGKQIREGQGAADGGECGVGWGDVVVPSYEAMGTVSFVLAFEVDDCLPDCAWDVN